MSGYIYPARSGPTFECHGARIAIKASGQDTHGQLAVMESTYPAGLSVSEHFHDGEDEMFFLLEGRLQVWCDGKEWTAEPGSFVFVPRNRPHSFTVTGDSPARALVVLGPPNLDRQIAKSGIPVVEQESPARFR